MSAYQLVVQETADCFCVYAPGLPGCIATGDSEAEARERMEAAIRFHIRGLEKAGLPVPEPAP